jgi:hypothetical protein
VEQGTAGKVCFFIPGDEFMEPVRPGVETLDDSSAGFEFEVALDFGGFLAFGT